MLGRPYRVREESLPGAPFFRVEPVGGQTVLYLNTAHRFYTDVYAGPGTTPRFRAALEIMLFVIGECEIDADGERKLFYRKERMAWSEGLYTGLDRLDEIHSITDTLLADDEMRAADGAGAPDPDTSMVETSV
jgi:hypothetical protein